MTNSSKAAAVLIAAALVAGFIASERNAEAAPESAVIGRIRPQAMLEHIAALADSSQLGRANGSSQIAAVADDLARRMKEMGLQPAGEGRTYRLPYGAGTGIRVQGIIGMRDLARGYAYNTDYTPLGLSANGHETVPLAFAGYGISAPELGYDDFADLEVRGRHVLVLAGEPGMEDPASPFGGTAETRYSDIYYKAANCQGRGAAGMLLVTTPHTPGYPDRAWKVSRDHAFVVGSLPVCQVTSAAAHAMLEPYELDVLQIQEEIDRTFAPRSFDLPESKLEMKVWMQREPTDLVDIVGRIPGQSEGVVLVLAHYDGPGLGHDNATRSVHPAANEASGVAALMEVAAALKQGPTPPRTLVFAAVSGYHLFSAGAAALAAAEGLDGQLLAVVELGNLARSAGDSPAVRVSTLNTPTERLVEIGARLADPVEVHLAPASDLVEGDLLAFRGRNVPLVLLRGGWFAEDRTPRDTFARIDRAALERNARYACAVVQMFAGE